MAEGEGDSSDFTFCQVDECPLESPKALSSLQNITLADAAPGDNLNLKSPISTGTGTGTSNGDAATESKPAQKKAPRAKVPFEKGYSQMDWLKLTRTHPDLPGLNGRSNRRLITLEEVKQHKTTEGHIWTVLKGRVYNISPYLKFHPGGRGLKKI